MTTEEKAKAYDEAFKRAKAVWRFSSNSAEIMRMEEIFPELQESEDEKIRKWLIHFINGIPEDGLDFNYANIKQKDVLVWLEKQGEHKPEKKELKIIDWSKHIKYEPNSPSIIEQNPAWSEEDDYNLQCMTDKVTYDIQKGNVGRNNELMDWLKSLKDRVQPKPKEWSEDDEETLGWLCTFLKEYGHEFYEGNEDNVVDWLKSLKDKL